jgi:hypothetical protein
MLFVTFLPKITTLLEQYSYIELNHNAIIVHQ